MLLVVGQAREGGNKEQEEDEKEERLWREGHKQTDGCDLMPWKGG